MNTYGLSRGAIAVGLVTLALGVFAMVPGSFGSALAQTAGGGTPDESTGTTTTTSNDGTTTTTTTASDGTKTTETEKPTGEKVTETAKPDGSTTTVVETVQGTVTVVQTPGQPVQVSVVPSNPNVDANLVAEAISASFSVPAGTLSADEAISIVEQSFEPSFTVTLAGVTRIENVTRLGDGTGTAVENFAAAGSIRAVKVFEMTVKKGDGTIGQIDKPILMTWDFKPQELAEAGGDFANLLMISYSETTKVWTPVKQVSHTATSATFEVPHFSRWAFAVRTPGAVTPPAATPAASATPAAPGQVAPTPATGTGTGAAPALTPRPANTGTGIPAQPTTSAVLPFVMAVLGLGLIGGIGLRTVRRRS